MPVKVCRPWQGRIWNEQLRRLLPGSSIPPNRLLCPLMRPLARLVRMDSSYSLTEHVRPEDGGRAYPVLTKRLAGPVMASLKPIAAPPRGITESSSLPPSGRVGSFFLLLLAHHPKVVCKLLNLVLFRSTNNDINYLYHLRIQ